jgi:hypothetical protein
LSPRRQQPRRPATGPSGSAADQRGRAGSRERPPRREAERPGAQAGSRRGRPSGWPTRGLVPGETDHGPGPLGVVVGTVGRNNPHTGPGRKAAAVRRRGGPGDHDLGRDRSGPPVQTTDRLGGRDAETVGVVPGSRSRTRFLGSGSGDPGRRWTPRRPPVAGSTGYLSSENSPPASVGTRTSVRLSSGEHREGRPSGRPSGGCSGEPGTEPQGCEWTKHSTGSEQEKAARVVENDGGGPKRGWAPATRVGGVTGA